MDHQRGKDPIPQGRVPETEPSSGGQPVSQGESQKYENSAPGPAATKDGAFFFGYKKDRNNQGEH